MARWEPETDKPIGSNEHLGRRLFDEPILAGAQDQKPYVGLDYRHFEEKRIGDDVSLDRLGRTCVEKSIVRYLLPLAMSAAESTHETKIFHGWSVLKAQILRCPPRPKLPKFEVVPSPVLDQENVKNIYHAHIIRGSMDPYILALHLRQLFAEYGNIEPAMSNKPDSQETS